VLKLSALRAFAKQALAIAFVLGWRGACSGPPEPMTIDSATLREQCPSNESADYFFPEYLFAVRGYSGNEFAATLSSASEPSLSCGANTSDTYRIVGIDSFGTRVIVRIAGSEGAHDADVVTTELETSNQESKRLKVIKRTRRQVDRLEWNRVKTDLDRLDYWSRPMFPVQREGPTTAALDGTSWFWEGRDRARYHAILRGEHQMPPDLLAVLKSFQLLGEIRR
jgi:hypothetical protein